MKLIIDIDNNDYELINKTGVTLDLNTVFHGKEKDKEMTFAIFDLVKALKNGIPYEERPQGKWIIDGHHIRCNKCNEYICTEDREGNSIPDNFCPNCGAKMEAGDRWKEEET